MKHCEVNQLSDLVTGAADESARTAMEPHLSTGCKKCRRTVEILRKVAAAAIVESHYQVPDQAVRNAREIFGLQQPEKVYIRPDVVAQLVFDSFRQPFAVGVRSQGQLARQTLYEAEGYSLDLRLERETGAPAITLVGQIARQGEPEKPMGNRPVWLFSGNRAVAHTQSNSLGEFQIEYLPRPHLRLYVEAEPDQSRIAVPLNQIGAGGEEKGVAIKRRARRSSNNKQI